MSLFINIATIISLVISLIFLWRCYNFNTDVLSRKNSILILFRQCARWSTASTQDSNPLIANLHANYAAGYLWAMEDLFTADEISKTTGIDYKLLRSQIQKNQDITSKNIKMKSMNNDLERGKELFYQFIRRQNILWDLIDAKIIEEEGESKPLKVRKKAKPKIELQTETE